LVSRVILALPLVGAWACEPGGAIVKDGVDTGAVGDADVDADADGDADADADGDADGDTDAGTPPDLTVDCEGSADYTEIQAAIEASTSGDRIGVMACEYHERLDFLGKSIEVYGIDGSSETILDADEGGTAVNVETGEGAWTRFAGFTVTGGKDPYAGSGMEIELSVVELEDVVFTGNDDGDSVIQSLTGWVDMKDVTVSGNSVLDQAIYADGGILTVEGLDVDCDGGSVGLHFHLFLNMDSSTINCDGGYGMENYHGEMIVQRSTITGGEAGIYSYDEENTPEHPDNPSELNFIYNSVIGGGAYGARMKYQYVVVTNSVLWGDDAALSMVECNASSYAINSAFVASACGIEGDQAFSHTYSSFYDNLADGCGVTVIPAVSADPEFTSFPTDLTLSASSPLIDAGSPDPAYDDADGSTNDIGAYGGPYGSW
jgi:hypothetical protein